MSVSHHDQQRSTASQSIPSESPDSGPQTSYEGWIQSRLGTPNKPASTVTQTEAVRAMKARLEPLNKSDSGIDVSREMNTMTITGLYQGLITRPIQGLSQEREQTRVFHFDELFPAEQQLIDESIEAIASDFKTFDPSEGFRRHPDDDPLGEDEDPLFSLARRIFAVTGKNPERSLLKDICQRLSKRCPDAPLDGGPLVLELERKLSYVERPKKDILEQAALIRWEFEVPAEVVELDDPMLSSLAAFIVALQSLRGDGMVVLAQERIAELLGTTQPSISRRVKALMQLGYLKRLKTGSHGFAAEYVWKPESVES